MDGKRIRQINNITITLSKDNMYKMWDPNKKLLYASSDLQQVTQRCNECTDYLNKKKRKLKSVNNRTYSILNYTGSDLKHYVESFGALKYKERDFTKCIEHYINKSTSNRILSISGLRGTGKTTGILQSIYKLGRFNESVFISIQSDADISCSELQQFINEKYADKTIIVIDEITRVRGFIKGISFLADNYASNGKKVIISGTDSLAIALSAGDSLYHRIINKNVTFISYKEVKRTLGLSLSDYLKYGGLFNEDKIEDIDEAHRYIETAIVDNISNTLEKNLGAIGLLNINNMDIIDIRTVVFKVLYSIVYSNISNDIETDFNLIINLFDSKEINNYGVNTINDVIRQHLEVNEHITPSIAQINTILKFMQQLGLVIKAKNIWNKTEEKYYITNPSLYNQLLKTIVDTIREEGFEKSGKKLNTVYGNLFEAVILTHSIHYAQAKGLKVYYYRDKSNREIDLVFEKELDSDELFDEAYAYYELKLNSNPDIVVCRTRWLNNEEVVKNIDSLGKTIGKGIIYNGETKQFKGYTDKQIVNNLIQQVKSREKVINQEKLNAGTMLISAEDFLLKTDSILKELIIA